MMLKSFCIILFSILNYFTQAQSLNFKSYTTKDGLLSDDVYKIFQDKNGYIWLFTNYGAMKYNGKKFESVLKNLPFNEAFIYFYYTNEKGKLWVVNSKNKFYEVKNDSAFLVKNSKVITEEIKKEKLDVQQFYIDDASNVFINTNKGCFKFFKSKNYNHFSNLGNYTEKDSVLGYLDLINDNLFFSINADYIYHFYNKTKVESKEYVFRLKYRNGLNKNLGFNSTFITKRSHMPRLVKQFGKTVFFTCYNKIIKIDSSHTTKVIPFTSSILDYNVSYNNHLWIGTLNDGVYELNEKDSIINHYLIGKTINHILFDSKNGLWLSTAGFGLLHCSDLKQLHFDFPNPFSKPITLLKKINGKLFISNSLGEIFIIDGSNKISIQNKTSNDLLDVIPYHTMFIFCYRYHMTLLNHNGKFIRHLPLINPTCYPLKLYNLGSDSILCLFRSSILILKNGIISFESKNENKMINFSTKLFSFQKRNNDFLFSTDDGVYKLVGNELIMPLYLLPTKNCIVTKIVKQKNDYWFCTKGSGLFKLNIKNVLTHYTAINSLPSDIINDISFDKDNRILLSTNKGLFINENLPHHLNKWTEIYFEEIKNVLIYNNSIYMATNSGLVILDNNKRNEFENFYFNLSSIFVNGENTSLQKLKVLQYNKNNITFNFDVITFSSNAPDIQYILSGAKNKEGNANKQQINFQNLGIGSYTLSLKLLLNNNKVRPIIIQFNIIPAFWQTIWFKISTILFSILLVGFLAWQLFNYWKRKEEKKNEALKLITEYKLIALKSQINPHFMSNCLTAIQHLIISNKVDEANQYLAKFSLLVRQVLNFSSKPLVTLQEELDITELNIELEQLRFENKFEFEIVFPESINLKSVYIPPLILQPITENAIWHGLLPLKKERDGKLIIDIKIENNALIINIEDNGVGRKNVEETYGNLKESKGILITKQRIQNLNVFYKTDKADLFYTDLLDAIKNPMGTRVTIKLPLNLTPNNE